MTTVQRYRIGVDIGGTFTDFVLFDSQSGQIHNEKLLTTAHDPSLAVLDGISRLMSRHQVTGNEVSQVIHGTTLVANALIERKGVPTALITTLGFKDVLRVGLEWRYDTYDLSLELPPPLAAQDQCFEVNERVGPDGATINALDESSVAAIVPGLKKSGVQAAGICLLHAFQNPDHERRVAQLLADALPGLVTCTSSDVVPEIGEYERMSTTVANAYVLPIFRRYISGITDGLKRAGIACPLYLMLSDGGTVHESTAIRHPIRLVQSGPAGGVQATSVMGAAAGLNKVFCFDMGGTTAKACLIEDGEPLRGNEFEVARVFRFKKGSGLPLRIPVIDMIEIGAGGGSIARVNRLGLLQIGPDSASAEPGPACYGRGGSLPTVTDADLVLGYLSADSFLGGDMRLDVSAAREAIAKTVAEPLGLTVEQAAAGIHDLVNENMARASAIHALEKARRIDDYAMLPIGGAGPVHAAHIAIKLGLSTVMCPVGAGVASAFGFLASPMSFSFVRGRIEALDSLSFKTVNPLLDSLLAEGKQLLSDANVTTEPRVQVAAAMRYQGQGYEIDVPLLRATIQHGDTTAIAQAFEASYQQQFGRIEEKLAIEVVSWRLMVSGPRPDDLLSQSDSTTDKTSRATGESVSAEPIGSRPAWFDGAFRDTPVYRRDQLAPGFTCVGPALVEERESTLVIPVDATIECDAQRNLRITLSPIHQTNEQPTNN
ncbi:MAG: hydantoinase/oxoprolinase family protein [Burkholderiaceae bacterium]